MRILIIALLIFAAGCGGGRNPMLSPKSGDTMETESLREFMKLEKRWNRLSVTGDAASKACLAHLKAHAEAKDEAGREEALKKLASAYKEVAKAIRQGYDITGKMRNCEQNPQAVRDGQVRIEVWSEAARKAEETLPEAYRK